MTFARRPLVASAVIGVSLTTSVLAVLRALLDSTGPGPGWLNALVLSIAVLTFVVGGAHAGIFARRPATEMYAPLTTAASGALAYSRKTKIMFCVLVLIGISTGALGIAQGSPAVARQGNGYVRYGSGKVMPASRSEFERHEASSARLLAGVSLVLCSVGSALALSGGGKGDSRLRGQVAIRKRT